MRVSVYHGGVRKYISVAPYPAHVPANDVLVERGASEHLGSRRPPIPAKKYGPPKGPAKGIKA